jgi:hypothetical protein
MEGVDDKESDIVAEHAAPIIAPVDYNEPVVTRKELWSYYSTYSLHTCT